GCIRKVRCFDRSSGNRRPTCGCCRVCQSCSEQPSFCRQFYRRGLTHSCWSSRDDPSSSLWSVRRPLGAVLPFWVPLPSEPPSFPAALSVHYHNPPGSESKLRPEPAV